MNKFWRFMLSALVLSAGPGARAGAQSAASEKVGFEVATIKLNKSAETRQAARLLPGGRIEVTNLPLRWLVRIAYGSQTIQIQTMDRLSAGPTGRPPIGSTSLPRPRATPGSTRPAANRCGSSRC
jgi:hypothetical protein